MTASKVFQEPDVWKFSLAFVLINFMVLFR